jgi:RNA polymerase sigma-70 factor, ECF subfamily
MEIALSQLMSATDPDRELIRRLAAGEEAALRTLYATHGRRLYAYALRLTGQPAVAEEVLQDSLLAAWNGARSFRGEARALTWLLGIVHRQALNATRRKQLPTRELAEASEVAGEGAGPEAQVQTVEQRRAVRIALAGLSREHRAVLELVFYQGQSLAEAASICGCPVGTIKSRLSYAKARLRDALTNWGVRPEDLP